MNMNTDIDESTYPHGFVKEMLEIGETPEEFVNRLSK